MVSLAMDGSPYAVLLLLSPVIVEVMFSKLNSATNSWNSLRLPQRVIQIRKTKQEWLSLQRIPDIVLNILLSAFLLLANETP